MPTQIRCLYIIALNGNMLSDWSLGIDVISFILLADIELSSDPFDMSVPDPAQCGALASCLWEVKVS